MVQVIENVRLVPHSQAGRFILNSNSFTWNWNIPPIDSQSHPHSQYIENEEISCKTIKSIFIDELSSTAMISIQHEQSHSQSQEMKMKIFNFINGSVKEIFISWLRMRTREENEEEEEDSMCSCSFEISLDNFPYLVIVQARVREEQSNEPHHQEQPEHEQGQGQDKFDKAAIDFLDVFSKIPLFTKNLFNRLRGHETGSRPTRPSTGLIPKNPWIYEKKLELPASRISIIREENTTEIDSFTEDFASLPLNVKATMIYNSGGSLLGNSKKNRSDFWCSILISQSQDIVDIDTENQTDVLDVNKYNESTDNEHFSRIEKDLSRIEHECDEERLRWILRSYCLIDEEVGYVQGMGDLAASISDVIISTDPDALKCFQGLMLRLRANFLSTSSTLSSDSDSGIQYQLSKLRDYIDLLDPILSDYLKFNRDSDQLFFVYRWLLVLFRRELLGADVVRLWDFMLAADGLNLIKIEEFAVIVALAMILLKRNEFMNTCQRFEDLIKFFNEMAGEWNYEELIKLIDQLIQITSK